MWLYIFSFIYFNTLFLYSQNDTIVTKFEEVSVIGDKIIQNQNLQFNSNTIINNNIIKQYSTGSIIDVLPMASGIFIKDYGGLNGMKLLTIRGTNSNQNAVLLDGMKINSEQNGSIDLSIIPSQMIDKIEISKGGSSTEYGGNAIAGVVNLESIKKIDKTNLYLSYGSFRTYNLGISSGFNFWKSDFVVFLDYLNSFGDYPFKVKVGKILEEFKRDNSALSKTNLSVLHNNKSNLGLFKNKVFIEMDKREIPGPVYDDKFYSDSAKLKSSNLYLINQFSPEIDSSFDLTFNLNYKYSIVDYKNPNFENSILLLSENSFINKSINLGGKLIYKSDILYLFKNIEIAYEFTHSTISGDFINNTDNFALRDNNSILSNLIFNHNIMNLFYLNGLIGLRYDQYNYDWNYLAPNISIGINLINIPLDFKIAFTKNFRPPSFNELYYLNFGNINLKPEKSTNFNFNIIYKPADVFNLNLSCFYIGVNDQIISYPLSPVSWSAQNLGKVLTTGLEFSSSLDLMGGDILINLNYTLQSSINKTENSEFYGKQIIYIPQEMLNINNSYNLEEIKLGWQLNYVSYRYYLQNNDINYILPSYWVVDFFIDFDFELFKRDFKAKLKVNNVLNEEYSVIKNYPMYPTNFIFKLEMEL